MQGGQLDLIPQFGYQEGRPLFRNKALQVFRQKSAVHREIPMAVDSDAWRDRRVRVAMALLLNRPSIMKTLFGGLGTLGNDSPFAPNMLATNTSVPQRKPDVARARALLQAAGVSSLKTMVLALRAGQIDLVVQMSAARGPTFRNNSRYRVFTAPKASHRMFGMRVDREPFKDARVRRAVALSRSTVRTSSSGSSSARARSETTRRSGRGTRRPTRPSSSGSRISSSHERCSEPRDRRISSSRSRRRTADYPDHAPTIQAAGRQAGIDDRPQGDDVRRVLRAVGGGDYNSTTPWLNAPATITEYGFRGVPNLYLTAAYVTNGIWNASQVQQQPASTPRPRRTSGLPRSRRSEGRQSEMAGLLLRDTPVITAYFLTFVAAGSSKVRNYQADAISHIRVAKTSLALDETERAAGA